MAALLGGLLRTAAPRLMPQLPFGAPAGPPMGAPMGAPAGPPMGASMGASAGAGSWTAYFTNLTYVGIPVSWFVVLIFAGVVPIAPMSFFGYAGANLMISGSPWWAVAKTGVQIASYLGGRLLTAYFPELWPISMILSYNPWYIFDIVQMFDPNFKLVGFRTPFFTTPLGTNIDLQKGTFGSITLIHIFVLILIFSLGGFTLLDVIPSEISGNYKNLIKTIFKVVAGVTGLIGGGLMAATAMPGMFGALKGGTMRGGGQMEGEKMEGGKMTIDDVAKSLMKPDNSSAFLFMGILLTAALGGIALSSARIE